MSASPLSAWLWREDKQVLTNRRASSLVREEQMGYAGHFSLLYDWEENLSSLRFLFTFYATWLPQ